MLSRINITEKNKSELSQIECFSCKESLTAECKEIVAHNSVNGSRHPFHKNCILEYASFHKKNILPCPACEEELNIRSLFSWAELTRQSAGRFVWHAIPASLSAAATGAAGLITLAATARITAEPLLKERAAIAGISNILLATGALFLEFAARTDATPTLTILSVIQAFIAFNAGSPDIGPTLTQMIVGNGIIAAGILAGATAKITSEIAIEKLGKDLPAIKYGVQTGACAGLILLGVSYSKTTVLTTMTALAGIVSGILSIKQ